MPLNVWLRMVMPFEAKVELREKTAWVRGRNPTARAARKACGDGILIVEPSGGPPVCVVGCVARVWVGGLVQCGGWESGGGVSLRGARS